MEGSPLATLFRFWGYRRVYPVPSSLCLSQRSSQTKSLAEWSLTAAQTRAG